MHGVNYFDSYDWIGVCERLAKDREVVAFDHRGFGESTWSPSKNYSLNAKFDDIRNVTKALGWTRPIIMGHSGSGRLAIFFAAAAPDELSRLIVVDSGFEHAELPPVPAGRPPIVFPTVEAAMARYAKLENPPRMGLDRARARRRPGLEPAALTLSQQDPGGGDGDGGGSAEGRAGRESRWAELRGCGGRRKRDGGRSFGSRCRCCCRRGRGRSRRCCFRRHRRFLSFAFSRGPRPRRAAASSSPDGPPQVEGRGEPQDAREAEGARLLLFFVFV